jgi:hypothetical protein
VRLGDLVAGRLTDRRDTVLLGQVFWGWRVANLGAIRSEDGVVRAVEVFHRDVARTGNGAGQTG